MTIDIRKHLVPLELLDINECKTISDTVAQMENCAIGARMIGEAARMIANWIESGKDPMVIYDDPDPKEVGFNLAAENFAKNLQNVEHGHWALTAEEYASRGFKNPIIVFGHYPRRWHDYLCERGEDGAIFINNFGVAPSWVKDGYFKGFVNADPHLILPILHCCLQERIHKTCFSFSSLMQFWQKSGGVGHQVAHGFETFRQMIEDPEYTVMSGMSGIMTMAKMGGLISHMIDQKWVQAVASTGALMGHGLVEGIGLKHYKYDPQFSDDEYGKQRLNRITDTLEPEENLTAAEMIIHKILKRVPSGKVLSPVEINQLIGKHLNRYYKSGSSILRSAYRTGTPVFVPAFWDSELGNDIETECQRRVVRKLERIYVCPGIDNQLLINIVTGAKKLGVFILGGGTPRNYLMNSAPLIDIINERLGENYYPRVRYIKGTRICPDSMFLGHLSGCTWNENMTWGKTDTVHGRFSEVMADATMIYPFYMAAMKEVIESR